MLCKLLPDIAVSSHMSIEIWNMAESFVADSALVRCCWTMSGFMFLQMSLLSESFMAHHTLEGTFACKNIWTKIFKKCSTVCMYVITNYVYAMHFLNIYFVHKKKIVKMLDRSSFMRRAKCLIVYYIRHTYIPEWIFLWAVRFDFDENDLLQLSQECLASPECMWSMWDSKLLKWPNSFRQKLQTNGFFSDDDDDDEPK